MGKIGEFGLFVKQSMQRSGSRNQMIAAAKKVKKGHVAVWQLTPEGNRVGRKPVYRAFDGNVSVE